MSTEPSAGGDPPDAGVRVPSRHDTRVTPPVATSADLGAAFHASAIPQWVFDRETLRFLAVNQAAVDTYGYSVDEFLERTILDIRPLEDHGAVRQAVDGGGAAPLTLSPMWRHVWRNGETRFVRVSTSQIQFEGRAALLAQVFDITERVLAEQAVRENEQHLRRVLDNLIAFVGVMTPDGTLIEANRAPLEVLGVERADVVGRRVWDCPWWDYSPIVQAQVRDAVDRARVGEVVRFDVQIRIAGDARMWVDFQVAPVRDEHGRITHLIPSAVDLTARRVAEEALDKSTTLLRTISDESSDVIFAKDLEGRLQFANPATLALIGKPLEEVLGKTDADLLGDPEVARLIMQTDRRIMESGVPEELEEMVPLPDGTERVWLSRKAPARDREGRVIGLLGISRDITARTRAEAERDEALRENTRLFREAHEANALKDQFLATLSHELRTPLNAILGWTQMLRGPAVDQAKIARGLEVIERNTRAQAQLIADILDVSAIAAGKLSLHLAVVRASDAIVHAVDTIRPAAADRRLSVEVDEAAAQACVMADAARLQQVVWNLLSNAVKFTAPDGHIAVRVTAAPDAVTLAVQDDGIGIQPEFLPRVFDRFRQADGSRTRMHAGMGLGLAITSDLVRMHGGTIAAHSAGPNQGATFTVRLPRVHEPEATGAPEPRHADVPAVSVLIVDDHEDTRHMMEAVLAARGLRTGTAASTAEAVDAYAATPYDVALVDLSMPGEDGYACLRRLQALAAGASRAFAAIAVTAHAAEHDRAEALKAGFAAHISKPVDVEELLEAIRQAHARR